MVLVIAEQREGALNRASWEAIAAAQQAGGPVKIAIAGAGVDALASELAAADASEVIVIDHAALALESPTVSFDLPGGGRRLMQGAKGFKATIVSGVPILRDDAPTGALPGKLVRGQQPVPA